MRHTYKLRYLMERGEFSKDDIPDDNYGLADAMLVASVVYDPDGSSSTVWLSSDEGGEMPAFRQFNQFAILAIRLSEDDGLSPIERGICRDVVNRVRAIRGGSRGG